MQPSYAQESAGFEKIRDVSPDGKFAVRISCSSELEDPSNIDSSLITGVELVSLPSRKVVVNIGQDDADSAPHLTWSSDSEWFAFPLSEGHRVTSTAVYHCSGDNFTRFETEELRSKFSGPHGAWGEVLRGTHGLTPDKLEGYLKMRVQEYSKGFNWLPKDSHLQWLKKEIVTIDGRQWADWRHAPMLKGKKNYSHNPVYTRFLTTSYKGQLLEITFTTNLNTSPELKAEIDNIMDSVHLQE